MQNDSFIRVMHRIFSGLIYGSIALLVLWLVSIPIALIKQDTFAPNRSKQARYDTLFRGESGTMNFGSPALDNTGQLITKVGWEKNDLTYYGANGEIIAKLRIDSLKRVSNALRLLREKQSPQIDSVLLADPYAIIYHLPDRWFVGNNEAFSGYLFAPELSFRGHFYPENSNQALKPAIDWKHIISYKPAATVTLNQDKFFPYQLVIQVRRWSDLTPAVWPIMALTLLVILLTMGLFLLIVYWFRAIFAELLRGHYFERQIVRRVQYVGWLAIAMFIFKNVADVAKSLLAKHYLQSQGYECVAGEVWGFPDYWLWLWGGLVLLVFARIFAYGTRLQREHDLTI